MANKIQIKRSTTTAAPSGLANGELAYTSNGEILFVGHPDGSTGSVPIGGKRVPGVLTANQALVANSSSLLDKIWLSTEVLVGSNVDLTTSALLIGNSTVNSTVNSTIVQVSSGSGIANLTATQLNIGANVFANTSAVDVGNTIITSALLTLGGQVNANGAVGSGGQVLTSGGAGNVYWTSPAAGVAGSNSQIMFNANGVLAGDAGFTIDGVTDLVILGGGAQTTSPLFRVANSTTSANLSSVALAIGTATVNTTAFAVANATSNAVLTAATLSITTNATSTTVFSGNATVNSTASPVLLQVANSTSTSNLTATQLSVGANASLSTSTLFLGNTTVNSTHTAALLQVQNGTTTSNLTATSLAVGANVSANVTAFFVGNSTVNTFITQNLLDIGGQINANASVGSAGQVLVSGGAGNVYWTNQVVDTNTTYDLVTIANTTVGVVALDPSTGANDDVRFIGANGIIVTSDAVGNVIISTDSGGNGTFNNLIVSGNLTVSGTFTQFDVETLTVEDPLIELSRTQANTATFLDAIDIGFYGQYGNTANVVYTGLFRDASAADKTFRLFSGQIPAPGATVDTTNTNFGYANLIIHSLNGGNTNSTIDLFIIDGGTF